MDESRAARLSPLPCLSVGGACSGSFETATPAVTPGGTIDDRALLETIRCETFEDAVSLASSQLHLLRASSLALVDLLFRYLGSCCGVNLRNVYEYIDEVGTTPNRMEDLPDHFNNIHNNRKGLSLPASAIGWLTSYPSAAQTSSQEYDSRVIFPNTDKFERKVSVLKLLLATHTRVLKINGMKWPHSNNKIYESGIDVRTDLDLAIEQSRRLDVYSFITYFRQIQIQPKIDLSMFPSLTSLAIDGVSSECILHLKSMKKNLIRMKVERCCIFDLPRLLVGTTTELNIHDPMRRPSELDYYALKYLNLSHCGLGELSGVGISVKAGIIQTDETVSLPFALMRNLVSLNLSNNQLVYPTTALAGLCSLPNLEELDLSHNQIISMVNAPYMLGNIKSLSLSGNKLCNVRGIDRLYSLQRLYLDFNLIYHSCDVSGLANIPELMYLKVKGNPVEKSDPKKFRIRMLSWFRDSRLDLIDSQSTIRDFLHIIPTLDDLPITSQEIKYLQRASFVNSKVGPSYFHGGNTNAGSVEKDTIDIEDKQHLITTKRKLHLAQRGARRVARIVDLDFIDRSNFCHVVKPKPTKRKMFIANDDQVAFAGIDSSIAFNFSIEKVLTSMVPSSEPKIISVQSVSQHDACSQEEESTSTKTLEGFVHSSDVEEFESQTSIALQETCSSSNRTSNSVVSVQSLESIEYTCNSFEGKLSINESKDGEHIMQDIGKEFAKESAIDVEEIGSRSSARINKSVTSVESLGSKRGTSSNDESEHEESISQEIDKDFSKDCSQLRYNFADAERNATYDGDEAYGDILVKSSPELYFRTYVFPRNEIIDNYTNANTSQHDRYVPRIQLYQSDRELMMWSLTNPNVSPDLFEEEPFIGEKMLELSVQDVIPCGIAATGRIAPNDIDLLGFHREIKGKVIDSRKLYLCISDLALYFIPWEARKESNEVLEHRKFPSPLPHEVLFKDACWPHAFCRHPFKFLHKVTIGFGFQRLTLHFKLPSLGNIYVEPESESNILSAFNYCYVLLTCSKKRTIQMIQLFREQKGESLYIENDDRVFLDAIGKETSPSDFSGVILHYQVLEQRWLNVDYGSIRRSLLLSDDEIFLFHERFAGDDASSVLYFDDSMGDIGDVRMQIIDSAKVCQIVDIEAAHEDPKLITIIIRAESRLRRSHRWRLICADGESAERLVEDVRKVTQQQH